MMGLYKQIYCCENRLQISFRWKWNMDLNTADKKMASPFAQLNCCSCEWCILLSIFYFHRKEICSLFSQSILEQDQSQFTKTGRRGHDRMVFGFTTTYAIRAYHFYWWTKRKDPEKTSGLSRFTHNLDLTMLFTSPWSRFNPIPLIVIRSGCIHN
jgi:hypothetical protein